MTHSNTDKIDKKEEEDITEECCICFDAPKEALIAPCGHLSCCMTCAEALKNNSETCPICRGNIESIFKVFKA